MSASLNDLMDIYLAIKASGGSRQQAYTLKEANELRKLFEVIEQKQIKKEVGYMNIREENERLLRELKEAVSRMVEFKASVSHLNKRINDLFRKLESVRNGSIDFDSEFRRIDKEAKSIQTKLETLETFDFEAEVKKLRELEIKEASFRFKKDIA